MSAQSPLNLEQVVASDLSNLGDYQVLYGLEKGISSPRMLVEQMAHEMIAIPETKELLIYGKKIPQRQVCVTVSIIQLLSNISVVRCMFSCVFIEA